MRDFKIGEVITHVTKGEGVVTDSLPESGTLIKAKFTDGKEVIIKKSDIEERPQEKVDREITKYLTQAKVKYERLEKDWKAYGYPENYGRTYIYDEVKKVGETFANNTDEYGNIIDPEDIDAKCYDLAADFGRSATGIKSLFKRIFFGWNDNDPKQQSATIYQVRDDLGIRPIKPAPKALRYLRMSLK